jgi:hypothetical protein
MHLEVSMSIQTYHKSTRVCIEMYQKYLTAFNRHRVYTKMSKNTSKSSPTCLQSTRVYTKVSQKIKRGSFAYIFKRTRVYTKMSQKYQNVHQHVSKVPESIPKCPKRLNENVFPYFSRRPESIPRCTKQNLHQNVSKVPSPYQSVLKD